MVTRAPSTSASVKADAEASAGGEFPPSLVMSLHNRFTPLGVWIESVDGLLMETDIPFQTIRLPLPKGIRDAPTTLLSPSAIATAEFNSVLSMLHMEAGDVVLREKAREWILNLHGTYTSLVASASTPTSNRRASLSLQQSSRVSSVSTVKRMWLDSPRSGGSSPRTPRELAANVTPFETLSWRNDILSTTSLTHYSGGAHRQHEAAAALYGEFKRYIQSCQGRQKASSDPFVLTSLPRYTLVPMFRYGNITSGPVTPAHSAKNPLQLKVSPNLVESFEDLQIEAVFFHGPFLNSQKPPSTTSINDRSSLRDCDDSFTQSLSSTVGSGVTDYRRTMDLSDNVSEMNSLAETSITTTPSMITPVDTLYSQMNSERRIVPRNAFRWSHEIFSTVMSAASRYIVFRSLPTEHMLLHSDEFVLRSVAEWENYLAPHLPRTLALAARISGPLLPEYPIDMNSKHVWFDLREDLLSPASEGNFKLHCFGELRYCSEVFMGTLTMKSSNVDDMSAMFVQFRRFTALFEESVFQLGWLMLQLSLQKLLPESDLERWRDRRDRGDSAFSEYVCNREPVVKQKKGSIVVTPSSKSSNGALSTAQRAQIIAQATATAASQTKRTLQAVNAALISEYPELRSSKLLVQVIAVCFCPRRELETDVDFNGKQRVANWTFPLWVLMDRIFREMEREAMRQCLGGVYQKKSLWTEKDEEKRLKEKADRRAESKKKAIEGVHKAASRVKARKHLLWWDRQSFAYQQRSEQILKSRAIYYEHLQHREALVRAALFHTFSREKLCEWVHDSIVNYFETLFQFETVAILAAPKKPEVYVSRLLSEMNAYLDTGLILRVVERQCAQWETLLPEILRYTDRLDAADLASRKAAAVAAGKDPSTVTSPQLSALREKIRRERKFTEATSVERRYFVVLLLADMLSNAWTDQISSRQFSLHLRNCLSAGDKVLAAAEAGKAVLFSEEQTLFKQLALQSKAFVISFPFLRDCAIELHNEFDLLDREKSRHFANIVASSMIRKYISETTLRLSGEDVAAMRIQGLFRGIIVRRRLLPQLQAEFQQRRKMSYGEAKIRKLSAYNRMIALANVGESMASPRSRNGSFSTEPVSPRHSKAGFGSISVEPPSCPSSSFSIDISGDSTLSRRGSVNDSSIASPSPDPHSSQDESNSYHASHLVRSNSSNGHINSPRFGHSSNISPREDAIEGSIPPLRRLSSSSDLIAMASAAAKRLLSNDFDDSDHVKESGGNHALRMGVLVRKLSHTASEAKEAAADVIDLLKTNMQRRAPVKLATIDTSQEEDEMSTEEVCGLTLNSITFSSHNLVIDFALRLPWRPVIKAIDESDPLSVNPELEWINQFSVSAWVADVEAVEADTPVLNADARLSRDTLSKPTKQLIVHITRPTPSNGAGEGLYYYTSRKSIYRRYNANIEVLNSTLHHQINVRVNVNQLDPVTRYQLRVELGSELLLHFLKLLCTDSFRVFSANHRITFQKRVVLDPQPPMPPKGRFETVPTGIYAALATRKQPILQILQAKSELSAVTWLIGALRDTAPCFPKTLISPSSQIVLVSPPTEQIVAGTYSIATSNIPSVPNGTSALHDLRSAIPKVDSETPLYQIWFDVGGDHQPVLAFSAAIRSEWSASVDDRPSSTFYMLQHRIHVLYNADNQALSLLRGQRHVKHAMWSGEWQSVRADGDNEATQYCFSIDRVSTTDLLQFPVEVMTILSSFIRRSVVDLLSIEDDHCKTTECTLVDTSLLLAIEYRLRVSNSKGQGKFALGQHPLSLARVLVNRDDLLKRGAMINPQSINARVISSMTPVMQIPTSVVLPRLTPPIVSRPTPQEVGDNTHTTSTLSLPVISPIEHVAPIQSIDRDTHAALLALIS